MESCLGADKPFDLESIRDINSGRPFVSTLFCLGIMNNKK